MLMLLDREEIPGAKQCFLRIWKATRPPSPNKTNPNAVLGYIKPFNLEAELERAD